MSPQIKHSNAVVAAILEAAALYRVPAFRMQSGAMQVSDHGRKRPMYFGGWVDDLGITQHSGMADVLLTPRVSVSCVIAGCVPGLIPATRERSQVMVPVPLWVECKAGTGELRKAQKTFRDHVVKSGAFFLEAHDCADVVVQWFEQFGVTR